MNNKPDESGYVFTGCDCGLGNAGREKIQAMKKGNRKSKNPKKDRQKTDHSKSKTQTAEATKEAAAEYTNEEIPGYMKLIFATIGLGLLSIYSVDDKSDDES